MRNRHRVILRLESMEDRIVPSFLGIEVPHSVSANFQKLNHRIKNYANSFKNYVESLNANRPGQSMHASWQIHPGSNSHKNELFGIPWLKI
jgi:hypothetical protein